MEDGEWIRGVTRRLAWKGIRRIAGLAKRQNGSLQHSRATSPRSDGAITPCRVHSASHICDGHRPPLQEEHPPPAGTIRMKANEGKKNMPFSARLAIFEEKQPKRLDMNDLRAKRSFPNQARSRLIKLFFTRFCRKSITPILQRATGFFPFCGPKPAPIRANRVPSAFLNWP